MVHISYQSQHHRRSQIEVIGLSQNLVAPINLKNLLKGGLIFPKLGNQEVFSPQNENMATAQVFLYPERPSKGRNRRLEALQQVGWG